MNQNLRLDRLPEGSALEFAPDNEQGVVFLFAGLAKKRFGMRVESIQTGFPDCSIIRDGRRLRVEFEYRSKSFVTHGHDKKKCDLIVCWKHDWTDCPKHIQVIELQREFGRGFNIWVQAVSKQYAKMLPSIKRRVDWSVAPQANPGDLILFYHAKPEMCIRSIFRVDSRVQKDRNAAWKHGTKLKSKEDFWSYVKPVLHLKTPIHLSELRQHPVLAHTGHLRRQLIGRWRATPHWPVLFQMILDRNPAAKRTLAKFGPNRIV